MLRDPAAAMLGGLLLVGLGYVIHVLWAGRERQAPPPSPEFPIRHVRPVNVDANGRTLKVGVDTHAKPCDAGDKIECVCGLDDHEAAMRRGVSA